MVLPSANRSAAKTGSSSTMTSASSRTSVLAGAFVANAKEAIEKILARDPRFPGAQEKLARLNEELRPSAMVARSLLDDAQLRKRSTPLDAGLPDLGDLPGMEGDATTLVR